MAITGGSIRCVISLDTKGQESTASCTDDRESHTAQMFEGHRTGIWADFGMSHCLINVEADSFQIPS